MKLHTRILAGLVTGVAVGVAARSVPALAAVVTWIEPAGIIFIRLITMVVLPLVMALSLPSEFAHRQQILDLTAGVVLFTLAVQGTTVGRLIRGGELK